MSIKELPDECLLAIFNHLNVLDDLTNCLKVCVKWSHLVIERTRKVKYLIEGPPADSFDTVYYQLHKPIDGAVLSLLFGNLVILDYSRKLAEKTKFEDIIGLIKNRKSLKGLIHEFYYEELMLKYCGKFEMISTVYIDERLTKDGFSFKQLHLWNYKLDNFRKYAKDLPNLERLHIHHNEHNPDSYQYFTSMEKLRILEMALSSHDGQDTFVGFQFMDFCPNLQSAHIYVDCDHFFVDDDLTKHKSLQDLVLYFICIDAIEWDKLKLLFMKYSNLKHLALRENLLLKDEYIEQLVDILPNLVLFDVRGCPGVTKRSADYVRDYSIRYGRTIKFYFDENEDEIESDWPQLSLKAEKISRGFDFMKHCFLKKFYHLPVFLVPNENLNSDNF